MSPALLRPVARDLITIEGLNRLFLYKKKAGIMENPSLTKMSEWIK
jgi:hypothetical protein